MSQHNNPPPFARWAHDALNRDPNFDRDVRGVSPGDVSKRAQAICYVAGHTGQTLSALQWLKMLAPKMEVVQRGYTPPTPAL